jgi:peptidoglycan hydrolase-like protein with peptidoglycan-binding domain
MRRSVIGYAAAVVLVGAAVGVVVLGRDRPTTPVANDVPGNTAAVTRQTLVDSRSLDGELGYGPTTALLNRLAGTVTGLPEQGRVVNRGETLYRVDDRPVVLLLGGLPVYRDLSTGDTGSDVRQLEENLAALGYTGFTVDDSFTSGTAYAVQTWQKALGLEQTGKVELGRVVFLPAAVRVDSVEAGLGAPATPGLTVLHTSGTTHVVSVSAEMADQALLRKDTAAVVVLPGGKKVPATVTQTWTVIQAGEGANSSPTTKVEAVFTPTDESTVDGLGQVSVDVLITRAERPDVLTVPVAALVVLREGGYGVELIEGDGTRYVAVKTGLFANGRVEISGADITEGAKVGMPG